MIVMDLSSTVIKQITIKINVIIITVYDKPSTPHAIGNIYK